MQGNNIATWLWVCLVIFTLRVLGQFLVYKFDIQALPPFEAWYSGAISYKFLLLWQLFIMSAMGLFAYRISKNLVVPRYRLGVVLRAVGTLYFCIMFVRLLISLFGLSNDIWFSRPIPSFFHLILASYLFLVGRYHLIKSEPQRG